jgi:hypothetical protein
LHVTEGMRVASLLPPCTEPCQVYLSSRLSNEAVNEEIGMLTQLVDLKHLELSAYAPLLVCGHSMKHPPCVLVNFLAYPAA